MATKPIAWQEQGPVNSLEEWVNESWAQGEVAAIISHNSPLQDKKAPRAEPEEDIDVLEPGAQDKTLQESQTLSRSEIPDDTRLENKESTRISLCTTGETREMVTDLEVIRTQLSEPLQVQAKSEESVDLCEDAFAPPPLLSALLNEKCIEEDGISYLEEEVAEWISDAEIISDPTEDLTSPDSQNSQEWPPLFSEPVDREVNSTSEEMTQLDFLSVSSDSSEYENNLSVAAGARLRSTSHHSPTDRNNSYDTVSSPPFADESEEEEEVSLDIMSCQQQWTGLDIRSKPSKPSYSANISVSTEQGSTSTCLQFPQPNSRRSCCPRANVTLHPGEQTRKLHNRCSARALHLCQPLPWSCPIRGGAASQGSGCVVPVRERHSRAGERTERESKQTGGEEGQKESGLERNKALGQQHGRGLLNISKAVQTQELKTENCTIVSKHTRMECDSCDDSQSDSGVSADFSPCSTLEGNNTVSTGTPAAGPKETPIEREIRRAIEREHSLRRSRGLPNPPTSPEYVEIPLRTTVLYQSLTANSERCQGKDRKFAGKKMQHEIHEEVQREQDLVKLGKVPGSYDKGTVRQLKERKQIFEAFQKPSDSTLTVSSRRKATSWSCASDISTLENQEDISSQTSTIQGSCVERSSTQSPNSAKGGGSISLTPRGPGFPEGPGCQVIILENNLSVPVQKLCHAKPEAEPVTAVDSGSPYVSSSRTGGNGGIKGREQEEEEEEQEMAPKENPFFKLRSSTNLVKVEQDIREAQEREKELHKQRISVYGFMEGAKGVGVGGGGGRGGGGGGGKGRSGSIERKSPTLFSSSLNGLAVPGSSSRGVNGSPAVRQSVGKFGMWPPAQAEEEEINWPESPRTPRQKTPLVQRWESGLINGHNKEDD